MADDDEEPTVPKEEEEKLRGGEAAPPSTESERSAGADVEADASALAKQGSSGATSAANPDGGSFSQLLAGTMTSPAGSPRPSPVLTVPVVAVPCLLAPAALIESSGFAGGQFAMTHQAVLAAVTAQAQMQIQAACSPTSETKANSFPNSMLPTVTPVPLQQTSPEHESYSEDSYHWRKYGQKQVKNTENSRSYYKCAVSNCSSKKKVERSPDGKIREVIYRGKHNHDPPEKYRYTRYKGSQSGGPSGENESIEHPSNEPKESDSSARKTDNYSGIDPPEQQLFSSSDCEGVAGIATRKDFAEEPDPKRRQSESSKSPPTPAPKATREYVVQTETDARHLSDGYRWRKYGQKMVKGNPNPRSYYRCTHDGCPVRKHVEKASHDSKSFLITYEGKHNHDQPMPKYASDQPASDGPASIDKVLNTFIPLSDKDSVEELNPTDVVKDIPSDKAPEFGADKAKKSALSSTRNEGNERTSTEGVITPLLDKNPAAVSVKNS